MPRRRAAPGRIACIALRRGHRTGAPLRPHDRWLHRSRSCLAGSPDMSRGCLRVGDPQRATMHATAFRALCTHRPVPGGDLTMVDANQASFYLHPFAMGSNRRIAPAHHRSPAASRYETRRDAPPGTDLLQSESSSESSSSASGGTSPYFATTSALNAFNDGC